MAKYRLSTEVQTIPSSLLGVGKTLSVTIPRQRRRLETILLHARFAQTTRTMGANAWERDGLENFIKAVRLKVSDVGGTNRLAINASGASLLAWHKKQIRRAGRDTLAANMDNATGAYTHNLFIPIHLRHPLAPNLVGNRTCLPLDSRFINDDVRLEIDTEAAYSGMPAGWRATSETGTTNNMFRVILLMRDIPEETLYVPTEFSTQGPVNFASAGPMTLDVQRSGWLSSMMIEGYTAAGTRGNILSTTGQDLLKLYYGRQELRQFDFEMGTELDDWWSDGQANTGAWSYPMDYMTVLQDFWHDRTMDDGISPDTMINLYTDNSGDALRLTATSVKAASSLKLTTHKFLTPDISVLAGL